jgi:hypothetical protein
MGRRVFEIVVSEGVCVSERDSGGGQKDREMDRIERESARARARKRESESERDRQTDRQTDRQSVCACDRERCHLVSSGTLCDRIHSGRLPEK